MEQPGAIVVVNNSAQSLRRLQSAVDATGGLRMIGAAAIPCAGVGKGYDALRAFGRQESKPGSW